MSWKPLEVNKPSFDCNNELLSLKPTDSRLTRWLDTAVAAGRFLSEPVVGGARTRAARGCLPAHQRSKPEDCYPLWIYIPCAGLRGARKKERERERGGERGRERDSSRGAGDSSLSLHAAPSGGESPHFDQRGAGKGSAPSPLRRTFFAEHFTSTRRGAHRGSRLSRKGCKPALTRLSAVLERTAGCGTKGHRKAVWSWLCVQCAQAFSRIAIRC
ncbi:hypothetical protein MHYP_G00226920 [Metynnis hypsauchen]